MSLLENLSNIIKISSKLTEIEYFLVTHLRHKYQPQFPENQCCTYRQGVAFGTKNKGLQRKRLKMIRF